MKLYKVSGTSNCGTYFMSYLQSVTVLAEDKEHALRLVKNEPFIQPENKLYIEELSSDLTEPGIVDSYSDSDY